MLDANSNKLCECGCGNPAPLAKWNDKRYGHIKGQPVRYINGHQRRMNDPGGAGRLVHGYGGYGSGKRSKTYNTWASMMQRCCNPNAKVYPRYGGRGIRVCERWREFVNFLADMGERPPGKTLDRYPDNDGDYEPGNCRWATASQQQRNRRKGLPRKSRHPLVEAFGEKRAIRDWLHDPRCAVEKYVTLQMRLRKGWEAEKAITQPVMTRSEILAKRWGKQP